MTTEPMKALRLLGEATNGTFRIWSLMGPYNAGIRANILSLLTGTKVTKSKAGVIAMEKAFYTIAATTGECPAVNERNFSDWAKGQLA